MKKSRSIILVTALLACSLGVAACDGSDKETSKTTTKETTSSPTTGDSTSTTTTTTEQKKE